MEEQKAKSIVITSHLLEQLDGKDKNLLAVRFNFLNF